MKTANNKTASIVAGLAELVRLKYGNSDPQIKALCDEGFELAKELESEKPPAGDHLTVYVDGQEVSGRNVVVSKDIDGKAVEVVRIDNQSSDKHIELNTILSNLTVDSIEYTPVHKAKKVRIKTSNVWGVTHES